MKHLRKQDGRILIIVAVFFGLLLSLLLYSLFFRGFTTVKIGAQEISLESYCKNGYYEIPGEAKCSRAPNCGGLGYDELNTASKMPSYDSCVGNNAPAGKNGCDGYVPLCCYEVARTGDFTKCIGYWERLWCAKSQCDVARTKGASDSQCGGKCDCAHAHSSYCGSNAQPVALSSRIQGVTAQPTTPPANPTPTTGGGEGGSCPASSTRAYRSRAIKNLGDNLPAGNHPDKNINIRGYEYTDEQKVITDYPSANPEDTKAPQLTTLLTNSRPSMANMYKVYDWNWGPNGALGSRGGLLNNPYKVTMMGLGANPGDQIQVPDSGYNIGDGNDAYVLYATEETLTLVYLSEDRIVGSGNNGYAIHLDDICVDPNLVSLYNQLNSQGRKSLPVLQGKEVVGTARNQEVKFAIRDSGQFMDPRSDDWWIGVTSLASTTVPTPTGGNGAPAAPKPTSSAVNPTPSSPGTTIQPTQQACTVPDLPAPSFTSPTGLSQLIAVAEGSHTVSWNAISGATKYLLRIDDTTNGWVGDCSKNQNPGDICIDDLTTPSYLMNFTNGHKYGIWAAAVNSCGSAKNTAGIRVLGTTAACAYTMSAPTLIFPSTTTLSAGTQTIKWSAVANATGYGLRVNDMSNPWGFGGDCSDVISQNTGDICFDHMNTNTFTYDYPFQEGHTYGVWVAAENSCGWGGHHSGINVSVLSANACTAPPASVIITAPTSGTVGSGSYKIIWKPVAGATKYAIRINDESTDWKNNCADQQFPGDACKDNVTDTFYNHTFEAGKSYRIWIHALNDCGGWQSASNMYVQGINGQPTTPPPGSACTASPDMVQILSPVNATVTEGSYEIAWSPVATATHYAVRVDDVTTGWKNAFPCDPANQLPGDTCNDNLAAPSLGQYQFVMGHAYRIWVHALNNCGGWEKIAQKTVTVMAAAAANDKCIIQGFKIPEYRLNPGAEYWTYKQEIALAPIQVTGNNIVFAPGANISKDNPYFITVSGNQVYNVTVQEPVGYTSASTYCANQITCHTANNASKKNGPTRTDVFCPAGGWADVWWHFSQQATPTPACEVPGSPTVDTTSRVSNQLTSDPYDDQVNFKWNPSGGLVKGSDRYRVSLKESITDSWHEVGVISNNFYTQIADVTQNVGIQIAGVSTCGESAPLEIWSTVQGQPTPTPGVAVTPVSCLGVQHCEIPDGSSTLFSYCGACSGAGCDQGYTCRDSRYACKTFPNKKFDFDEVYQIPCSLLSPTPAVNTVAAGNCSACNDQMPYWCVADDPESGASGAVCSSVNAPQGYSGCSFKCETATPTDVPVRAAIPRSTAVIAAAALVTIAVVAAFVIGL